MDIIPYSLSDYTLESYLTRINVRSKIIYWIIIFGVITSISLLPFIYVDVTVLARGYFQPDIEKQIVSAPFSGKVIYSSVKSGKRINRGDTLLIIESAAIKAQKEALKQKISDNNWFLHDLRFLTAITTVETSEMTTGLISARYFSEYANFSKQYLIQTQKIRKTSSDHERNKILHDQRIIPDAEYENSLFTLNNEKENLERIILGQKAIWQSDLVNRISDSVKLVAESRQYEEQLSDRIILAPLEGEIIQSSDAQPGSNINSGQTVAEISPDGELLATCFVKPADIGLIYESQKAVIQVDAFNYQEWGMLTGHITDISDDMIVDNNGSAYFRIRCRLSGKFLELKNGYRAEMKKGMSLGARFIVTRRSIFNLLFDKADNWFNPYNNNPKGTKNENRG